MNDLAIKLYIALSVVIITTITWPEENPVTNLVGSMPLIGYVAWALLAVLIGLKFSNAKINHFVATVAGFAPLLILIHRIPVAL